MSESIDISVDKSVEIVKKPLFAVVGAGDSAVKAIGDVVVKVRENERFTLPEWEELRAKFTIAEVRKLTEEYRKSVLDYYADLAERGEGTVDRLRSHPSVEPRVERVETFYRDAVAKTEDVVEKVSERARDLVGRESATADAIVIDEESPVGV